MSNQEQSPTPEQPSDTTYDIQQSIFDFVSLSATLMRGRIYRPPPASAAPSLASQEANTPPQETPPSTSPSSGLSSSSVTAPRETPPSTSPPSPASRTEREARLAQLDQEIRNCQRCPLHRGRRQAVPGIGTLDPKVMAIGEAPGANEDAQGQPFVGRAGQYLDKWLQAINISRHSNAYIANIVKCRPPNNRDPEKGEVSSCRPFLDEQIALIVPRTILILGRIAAQHLFNTQESLAALRIRDHKYRNIPVFITYHPSAVLRNPNLRRAVWNDLQRLQLFLSHR